MWVKTNVRINKKIQQSYRHKTITQKPIVFVETINTESEKKVRKKFHLQEHQTE